ncbi:MAG: flagellar basal body rod C-terminal domain-containing protein [Phenylobacterium sp.]|nr:flagellar basal body rod C-terminal domain-containing protein [Phenylobacterium sp.]
MDPISTARYGLMAASRRFEASAQQIAGLRGVEGEGARDVDVAGEIVEMVQAKTAFSANLSVIRFAQDMWDSLLQLQTK